MRDLENIRREDSLALVVLGVRVDKACNASGRPEPLLVFKDDSSEPAPLLVSPSMKMYSVPLTRVLQRMHHLCYSLGPDRWNKPART